MSLLLPHVCEAANERHSQCALQWLAYIGHRGMGALDYRPELLPEHKDTLIDLSTIAAQSEQFLRGETSDVLEELRICGGSPGGARPKVTVAFSEDLGTCVSSFGELPENYTDWIVKFRNDGPSSAVVRGAVAKWPAFATKYDLSHTRTKEVAQALQAVDRETLAAG